MRSATAHISAIARLIIKSSSECQSSCLSLPFTSALLPTSLDLCCSQYPVLAWLGKSQVLSTLNYSCRPATAPSRELLSDTFSCIQKPHKHRWPASHFTSWQIRGDNRLGPEAFQCPHRAVTLMGQQHGHNIQEWKWPCPEERCSLHRRLLPKGGTGGAGCSPALSLTVDAVHLFLIHFRI